MIGRQAVTGRCPHNHHARGELLTWELGATSTRAYDSEESTLISVLDDSYSIADSSELLSVRSLSECESMKLSSSLSC